jgi:ankyrin repeat protein
MLVSAGLLIEAQADVNAADSYGRTPLLLSARMGLTPMAGLSSLSVMIVSFVLACVVLVLACVLCVGQTATHTA